MDQFIRQSNHLIILWTKKTQPPHTYKLWRSHYRLILFTCCLSNTVILMDRMRWWLTYFTVLLIWNLSRACLMCITWNHCLIHKVMQCIDYLKPKLCHWMTPIKWKIRMDTCPLWHGVHASVYLHFTLLFLGYSHGVHNSLWVPELQRTHGWQPKQNPKRTALYLHIQSYLYI